MYKYYNGVNVSNGSGGMTAPMQPNASSTTTNGYGGYGVATATGQMVAQPHIHHQIPHHQMHHNINQQPQHMYNIMVRSMGMIEHCFRDAF